MLDPPPMIEFLKLRACLVRIKGRHVLKWGTCSYSNTEQQYSTVQWQDREQAFVRPLNLKNTKPEKSEVKGESGRGHPGAKLGFVG